MDHLDNLVDKDGVTTQEVDALRNKIIESNKSNKIQKGDLVLLAAFGGGFTWGASLIRW